MRGSTDDNPICVTNSEGSCHSTERTIIRATHDVRATSSRKPLHISNKREKHHYAKKRKVQATRDGPCLCDRTLTRGPHLGSFDVFRHECVYAAELDISPCEIKRLERYIGLTTPLIKYYVWEMNKTFVAPGQRMYFSCRFTKLYLKDHLNEPVDAMTIKLSPEGVTKQVRMIMGTDKRATITNNWSVFVKAAGIKEFEICVFAFETRGPR